MLISKYYRAPNGTEPVKEYIDQLDLKTQDKIDQHIERLNIFGQTLDYPYTSQVEGELRELRAWVGRRHFRIYYQRSGRFAVLLHIIEKHDEKLPSADTATAKARWEDFKVRMDAEPRLPPRAFGSDAP
jgi:phage-related protein